MGIVLIIIILISLILLVYEKFLDYALEVNNRLVRVECTSHNNKSNMDNVIDIIEENRVERLKKSKE